MTNKNFTNNYTALRKTGSIETLCFKSVLNMDRSWTFKSRFNFYVDSIHSYIKYIR